MPTSESHRNRPSLAMALSLLTGSFLLVIAFFPTRTILSEGFASAAMSSEIAGAWELNPVTGHDVWVPIDICDQPWHETFEISVAEIPVTISGGNEVPEYEYLESDIELLYSFWKDCNPGNTLYPPNIPPSLPGVDGPIVPNDSDPPMCIGLNCPDLQSTPRVSQDPPGPDPFDQCAGLNCPGMDPLWLPGGGGFSDSPCLSMHGCDEPGQYRDPDLFLPLRVATPPPSPPVWSGVGASASTCSPVNAAYGYKLERNIDLIVALTGRSFSLTRIYTSDPDFGGSKLIGQGWSMNVFRFLHKETSSSTSPLTIHVPGGGANTFVHDGVDRWTIAGTPQYIVKTSLELNSEQWPVYRVVDPGNWQVDFIRANESGESGGGWREVPDTHHGLFLQQRDTYNNVHTAEYMVLHANTSDAVARLKTIYLNGTDASDCEASVHFTWHVLNDESLGRLNEVSVRRYPNGGSGVVVEKLRYSYKLSADGFSSDLGTEGLIQVVKSSRVDRSESSDHIENGIAWYDTVMQYRYYEETPIDPISSGFQLKMVIPAEQIEFAAQRYYESTSSTGSVKEFAELLLSKSDANTVYEAVKVEDLASKTVIYADSAHGWRVSEQYVQTGCGCSGSGTRARLTYEYVDFDSLTNPIHARTTIVRISEWNGSSYVPYLADFYDIVLLTATSTDDPPTSIWEQAYVATYARAETNNQGEPISGRLWVQHIARDADRQLHREYAPSAIASYVPAQADPLQEPTITFQATVGLVMEYSYTEHHYPKETFILEGDSGNRSVLRKITYDTTRPWLVTKVESTHVKGESTIPTDALALETIEYNYGFHQDDAIAWREVVIHAETSAEEGILDDDKLYHHTFFDTKGRLIWTRYTDGTLASSEYDPVTGFITRVEYNAAPDNLPSCTGCDYTGTFSGRNSEGGSRTIAFEYDLVGRLQQRSQVTGETSAPARTARITREMRWHEDGFGDDRPGIAYLAIVMLPHAFEDDTNIEFVGPAVVTWMNAAQKSIAIAEYSMTEGGTDDYGDIFQDYEHSFAKVNCVSRSTVQHDLSGTVVASIQWHNLAGEGDNDGFYVTEYSYDARGQLAAVTAPNNSVTEYVRDALGRLLEVHEGTTTHAPVLVREFEYDGGGAGDGNLTKVIAHVDGTEERETTLHYDHRNRLVAIENPDSPHLFIVYDNFNRISKWAVFSELPSSFAPEDIDDTGVRAKRGAYGEVLYNRRGLAYRHRVAIDATEASLEFLESNTWFDSAGRVVSQSQPNSPATMLQYTALGQLKKAFTVAEGGDPADLEDAIVFEQVEYTYRENTGEIDLITTRVRTHDAEETMTGDLALVSGGDSNKVITSYSGMEYDAAGRVVRSLEFGTNASSFQWNGTAPQLNTTVYPPRWNPSIGEEPITVEVKYNTRGIIDQVMDPKGRVTSIWYDNLNRRIAVVENHVTPTLAIDWNDTDDRWEVCNNSSESDEDRVTTFVYRVSDNIVEQVAHAFDDSSTPAATVQVTRYVYGTVAGSNPEDSRISSNNLLAAIHYPDRTTGLPTTAAANTVTFAYNRLGEVRFTQDQNGTTHTYGRDEMGRVTSDVAGFATNSPIDDAIDSITMAYDEFGRPSVIQSLKGTTVKNAVEMTYTPLWQIQDIYQEHSGPVDTNTPKVTYTYDTQPAGSGNYSRPISMEYPTTSTVLEAIYNTAGSGQPPSIDHVISRLRSLKFDGESVVDYDFIGLSLPSIVTYPEPDVELNWWLGHNATGASGVYPGFDRFGRTVRHKWVDGDYGDLGEHATHSGLPSIPSIVELAYVYDQASNIIEKYDARPGAKQSLNHQYVYDGLNRLIEAKRGSGFDTGFTSAVGGQQWTLDHLGNHREFNTDLTGNGQYGGTGDLQIAGTYNFANEIDELTKTESGSPVQLPFVYDAAGNMQEKALSGSASLSFTHDAWNRLVIVRRMFGGFGSSASLAEYQYNGLHQRIIKRVDTSNPGTSGYETLDRQHQFYYSAAWQIAEELIDNDWSEMGPSVIHIVNEYVWGVRHVDDIVLRRRTTLTGTPSEATWYHLTDHQFSTVALLDNAANLVERVTYDAYGEARHHHAADLTGDGAVGTADQTAMAAAYKGKIGDAEYNVDADISRTGAVSGTDLGWTTTQNFKAALPKGTLTSRGNTIGYAGYVFNPEISIYTVRFRHYDPVLGRWLERDPLGYVDGMSLYEYVRGNSVNAFDPFGLCSVGSGPSAPIVEAPMGPTPTFRPLGPGETPPDGGQTIVNPDGWGRSGFFGNAADMTYKHLGDYVKGAVVGAATAVAAVAVIAAAAAVSPVLAIGVGGALAIYGIYGIYTLYSDWDDYSDAQKAGILGGVIGGFVAAPAGPGIARRVPTRARTNTSGSSSAGCFLAGTLVVTATGMAPIEQVGVGESVWSYDHEAEQWELREVLHTFEHDYLGDLVTLKLEFDDGSTDEITATGNHPFWVVEGEELAVRPAVEKLPGTEQVVNPYGTGGRWTEARYLRLGDHFLTRTGKSATVAGLTIRTERVKVYNLHVEGLHLYAVGEHGVLVHNKIPKAAAIRIQNAANKADAPIFVVGSRARGTARHNSDWDYVVPGLNSRIRHKIRNSLPGAKDNLDGAPSNLDIFPGPVDTTRPHIPFYPQR